MRIPSSPSDTRPIANLPELSKILEKIVYSQISAFLDERDVLSPRQSAYRPHHNTQTALLRVTNDIRFAIDSRLITIMVLFDFSKAFDTVPHLNLLIKLKKIGFSDPVVLWIYSYLSGRTQAVLDETDGSSSWLTTTSGVPQKSVLGPLLFSLYINDIGDALSYSNHMIFADDIQIYLSCSPADLRQDLKLITHDATALSNYASTNGLHLNPAKSKVIIFGSAFYTNNIDFDLIPPVVISGVFLPFVDEVRNLGVIFDSNLAWKQHISYVSQRVHLALFRLKFNKNILSTALRTNLVVSLILPLIDYCCLVYHGLTAEFDTKLQRLVNCAIRFIFNLKYDDHITPYRCRLGWLTVKHRRLYFLGCQVYRIVYGHSPSYLSELFIPPDPELRRSERHVSSSQIFHVPSHRTAAYSNSFLLSSIYLWHSLPFSITSASSLMSFKGLLRQYLLNCEHGELDAL